MRHPATGRQEFLTRSAAVSEAKTGEALVNTVFIGLGKEVDG